MFNFLWTTSSFFKKTFFPAQPSLYGAWTTIFLKHFFHTVSTLRQREKIRIIVENMQTFGNFSYKTGCFIRFLSNEHRLSTIPHALLLLLN